MILSTLRQSKNKDLDILFPPIFVPVNNIWYLLGIFRWEKFLCISFNSILEEVQKNKP